MPHLQTFDAKMLHLSTFVVKCHISMLCLLYNARIFAKKLHVFCPFKKVGTLHGGAALLH